MIALIIGFLIGMASTALGYGIGTWQFWFIAMPIAMLLAILIRR